MQFIDNGPEKGLASAFRFEDFEFDPAVEIAPSIYIDQPQQVTDRGCIHLCRSDS